jgi:hypothetical protein
MFTVYEREEVLIECSRITHNKNDDQPYWEKIDENDNSCNLIIREGKEGSRYGLKKDPSCLKILNTQMSDGGYYYCCIDYSASNRGYCHCCIDYSASNGKQTVRSKIIKLIIEKSRHIL